MNLVPRGSVVVGLERSDEGQAAAEYAAEVADRRHVPLLLVHAFEPSPYIGRAPTIGWGFDMEEVLRDSSERLLDEAAARLSIGYPDLEVISRTRAGSAAAILIEESKRAALLVVGSRGQGGFADLVIGSTTLHVTSHAHCPVVVVPGAPVDATSRHGVVVVGVDGTDHSEAAIAFAFQMASETREKLTAVHAWHDPASMGVGVMMPLVYDPTLVEREEELALAESMAGWSAKFPDVEVEQTVVRGHPVHALVTRAATADLLVVGSRGRGSLRSLLLGSVCHGVLHHASGPVAIVPAAS